MAKRDPAVRSGAPTFDDVYEESFDYVFRIVARLANCSAADAEDLAQEVFVVAHRRLAEFEGRAQLSTWLFQIAYRVVGAHVRKERLRRMLAGVLRRERSLVAREPSAPELLERAQQAAKLMAALDRLSWKKRAALVLHEIEGWSCPEIAARLGVPVDTVYTRLHHARRDLARELLAKEQP